MRKWPGKRKIDLEGAAGRLLFMLNGEAGAEVYAVATTREQAMTVFKPAFENFKRWRRVSPGSLAASACLKA
jgi:phage terminase large subunit-like protein